MAVNNVAVSMKQLELLLKPDFKSEDTFTRKYMCAILLHYTKHQKSHSHVTILIHIKCQKQNAFGLPAANAAEKAFLIASTDR